MEDFLKSYKRTLEELRKDYPKYKVWSDNYFFTFYGQILEEQIINEFITKTIDINKTIEELKNRFSKKFYSVKKDNGDVIITFENGLNGIINNQFENIDEINKFMDSFGWFTAKINGFKFNEKTLNIKKQTSNDTHIRYEGKFDTQVISNEKYYYHLTPDLFYPNIESNGLTPKNKAKISNHPERIYLIKEYNKNEFKFLAERLYYNLGYRSDIMEKIKNYYILRIDVEALIKSGRDKFYRDPNYSLGIWTYENIPPLYIEKIGKISVNQN
jgi:hypothetical protein